MKKNGLKRNLKQYSLKKAYIIILTLTFVFLFTHHSSAWEVDIRDKNSMPQGLVVVDKTQKRLSYFEKHSPLILLHEYPSIHGENEGDKMMEGDLKTPEGVYFITTKIKMELDFDEYGSQAHALNYPNPVDRLRGKTGGGIWIHSKGSPIKDQTTQGCVAIDLDDIEELGTHLMSGTPVLIAQSVTRDGSIHDSNMSEQDAKQIPSYTQENHQTQEQNPLVTENNTASTSPHTNAQEAAQNQEPEGFLQSVFADNSENTSQNQDLSDNNFVDTELIPNESHSKNTPAEQIHTEETLKEQASQDEIFSQNQMPLLADSDTVTQSTEELALSQEKIFLEEAQDTRQMRRHERTPTESEKAMQAQIEAQIAADIQAQHNGSLQKTPQEREDENELSRSSSVPQNDEQTLIQLTQEWNNAWADRSYAFFNFYDKESYAKAQGQSFNKFFEQKDYLFRNMSWLFISYQDINALEGPGYWVTWFPQYYRAPNHKTEGIRRLYWQKDDNNEYKIVAMEWLPRNLGLDKEFTKHVENTVPHFVEAWRLAWKEADSSSYESFYAIDAQQDALKGIAPIMEKKNSIWEVKKPTEIVFSNIRIDARSNAVHVYMNQAYSDSSGYRDYGVKRLVLHPRGSSWIIAQESWSRR